MKQTPLEIARNRIKNCCCNNCECRVIVNDTNYCESDGRIILEMHLDSNREVQCKDVFKRKEVSMKPFECKWFACVYAMKTKCAIDGYMDEPNESTGEREICTNYKDTDCIRAKCAYCSRLGNKNVCPNESEGE